MDSKELKLLLKIHEDIAITKADCASIKETQIQETRRIALLEGRLETLNKKVNLAHGAILGVTFLITMLARLKGWI